MEIRFAQESDCKTIASIESASLPYEVRSEPLGLSQSELIDMWQERIATQSSIVMLASIEHIDCAFLSFQMHARRSMAFINALYVRPEYFRRGIARTLITSLEQILRKMDYKQLCLNVQQYNYHAIELYTSMNFSNSQLKLGHLINMYKDLKC